MSVLDPRERTSFGEVVRPPPGYVLEACLGTTFSLDLNCLTALALAFVGADSADERLDAATAVTAMARLRRRLRVLVDPAGLHAPDKPRRLHALFDRLIHPVRLPGGAFHPKVWILSFAPRQTPELRKLPRLVRVLCGSRNLTTSQTWEIGAVIEGTMAAPRKRHTGAPRKTPLGSSLEAFILQAERRTDRLPPAVRRLAADVATATFDLPTDAGKRAELLMQWPGLRPLVDELPKSASRALVISPFLRGGFVDELFRRFEDLVLVSTQAELDALPAGTRTELERRAGQKKPTLRAFVVQDREDEVSAGLDLHAKLIVWERDGVSEVLVGSANATLAGWGMGAATNSEAMLAMRPGPGVDAVHHAFVESPKGHRPWIDPYVRQEDIPDDEDIAQKRLDDARRAVGRIAMEASYDVATHGLTLRASGSDAPPERPFAGVSVEIAPLLRSDEHAGWQPLERTFSGGATFNEVPLVDLCAFALVRLRDERTRLEKRFLLQFSLKLPDAIEDDRQQALSERLLDGIDPGQLLLNVILGLPMASGAPGSSTTKTPGGDRGQRPAERLTIERVLHACTADPGRVEEIDSILRASRRAPELEAFYAFWAEFKAALGASRMSQ